MDTNDTTNPAETPVVDAPEVETPADEPNLTADNADEADFDGEAPLTDEEYLELEKDGKTYKVPKAVEDLLMMQKDYTQKTQTLAEQRKEIEARRQAFEWQQKTTDELFAEKAQLHTVQSRLQQYQNVNWQALQQQDAQKFAAAQAEYMQLRDFADRLSGHVSSRESQLKAMSEQETAIALERAVETLNKPRPDLGWDGRFDAKKSEALTNAGVALGYSKEELQSVTDPRQVMALNLVNWALENLRKQSATIKRPTPEAKPVPQVATGKTRVGPSNPDKLPIDDWLKYRESQLAKKQQRNR